MSDQQQLDLKRVERYLNHVPRHDRCWVWMIFSSAFLLVVAVVGDIWLYRSPGGAIAASFTMVFTLSLRSWLVTNPALREIKRLREQLADLQSGSASDAGGS